MSYMVRCRELRSMDLRHQENAHDNTPSQKYRVAGFTRYFVTFSAVDSFYKNSKNSKKDKYIVKVYTLQAACTFAKLLSPFPLAIFFPILSAIGYCTSTPNITVLLIPRY